MSYEKRPNTGTLGKNKNKEKDTHPDYSGQLNVDGTDYWLSGWLKENKGTGEKFFSLSVKQKEAKTSKPTPVPMQQNDPEDEIPFAWTFAIPAALILASMFTASPLMA